MNRYSLHRGWYVQLYHAASVCGNNPRFAADLSEIFHYVQFQVVFFLNIAASAAAAALSFSSDPLLCLLLENLTSLISDYQKQIFLSMNITKIMNFHTINRVFP